MTNQTLSSKALDQITSELKQHRTREEYAASVIVLLKLALDDTSGSLTAAQVLLSCYNGYNWQLDVTDLCHLDREYLRHALIVMECRATLWAEPHDLVKNGDEHFTRLQKKWRRYHIRNRWKDTCGDCSGTGKLYLNSDDDNDDRMKTCLHCEGKGLIAEISEF